MDKLKK